MISSEIMSLALISPFLLALIKIVLGVLEWERTTKALTLRTISVTDSSTPESVENSWETPSIRIEVTAEPSMDDKRIRRKELPKVTPYPRSKGSATNLPYVLL